MMNHAEAYGKLDELLAAIEKVQDLGEEVGTQYDPLFRVARETEALWNRAYRLQKHAKKFAECSNG